MGLNILVVDDSIVMRTIILRILALSRVPVNAIHQAGDGREALRIIEREPIDLALIDINMPVMDGEELITALRANPSTADLPVLVVSTEGSATRIARVRAMGADFIHKPFTPEKLRDQIVALTGARNHDACGGAAVGSDFDF